MEWVRHKLFMLDVEDTVSHCLVLTTTTNGACLDYCKSVDVPVLIVKAGMEYSKPAALEYLIGAYMLPDGDGTICVNWRKLNRVIKERKLEKSLDWLKMKALLSIANPACGDAVANILLIECILRDCDYNFTALLELYKDRPNNLSKAYVYHPKAFLTSENGQKITEPVNLQIEIESITDSYAGCRIFIRPEPLKDFLWIYVEAISQKEVNDISNNMLNIIEKQYKNHVTKI